MYKIVLAVVFIFVLSATAQTKSLTTQGLEAYIKKRIIVIDIRSVKEQFYSGIVPTSYRISLNKYQDFRSWLHVFNRLVKQKSTAFVLISGDGIEAKKVASRLSKKYGYLRSYYLKGGIDTWINRGKRVVEY